MEKRILWQHFCKMISRRFFKVKCPATGSKARSDELMNGNLTTFYVGYSTHLGSKQNVAVALKD